ncbi:MAG: DNA-binding protein WhiA [Lachnospiraceae bacterium]
MSFSSEVKFELAELQRESRHCQLAELAAIISFAGRIQLSDGMVRLQIHSENGSLTAKYSKLLFIIFQIEDPEIMGTEDTLRILESVKIWSRQSQTFKNTSTMDRRLIQSSCCKRSFIRGAFLAAGSISNPDKSYHFEIVCSTIQQAEQLQSVMNYFEVEAKIVARKKHFVVYLKEGAHIVEILNVMEAHIALMNLENVRILKEMRNSVNRQVNCETANISKTVNASIRQIEAIEFLRDRAGLESLADNLREIALIRLEQPDMPLKELGELLDPKVGKSGVNHRLRKIVELAQNMGFDHKGKI